MTSRIVKMKHLLDEISLARGLWVVDNETRGFSMDNFGRLPSRLQCC